VRAQPFPIVEYSSRGREAPHVGIARLAQDASEQPPALRQRRAREPLAQLGHRHRLVPEEIRDRRFVVEIKSAPEHAGIRTAAVRRQVIEYLWAAEMPCLLLTMPAGEIEIISFGDSGSVDAFADDVGQGDQMEGG